MRWIYFILFSGISWTSKLIKFWTRSKRSHAAFVNPDVFDMSIASLYKDNALIEAWNRPKEPIWKTRCIYSSLRNHKPKTPFTLYKLEVTEKQVNKIYEFQHTCAFLEIPYDWKAIVGFVLPMKLKKDGYLFCSEKECLSLKYAGVLKTDIPCWKMSPDLFEDLLITKGAQKVGDFIV